MAVDASQTLTCGKTFRVRLRLESAKVVNNVERNLYRNSPSKREREREREREGERIANFATIDRDVPAR